MKTECRKVLHDVSFTSPQNLCLFFYIQVCFVVFLPLGPRMSVRLLAATTSLSFLLKALFFFLFLFFFLLLSFLFSLISSCLFSSSFSLSCCSSSSVFSLSSDLQTCVTVASDVAVVIGVAVVFDVVLGTGVVLGLGVAVVSDVAVMLCVVLGLGLVLSVPVDPAVGGGLSVAAAIVGRTELLVAGGALVVTLVVTLNFLGGGRVGLSLLSSTVTETAQSHFHNVLCHICCVL